MKNKFECPCCGQNTLDESPPGTYQVCSACNWEDDLAQYYNPNSRNGANKMSLSEAKDNYQKGLKNTRKSHKKGSNIKIW